MPTTPVNKYKTFLALAFLLFGFAFAATADDQVVLLLKNGDRVTGTITLEKTNEVIIATTWAKEVAIPLSMIDKREKITVAQTNAPAQIAGKMPDKLLIPIVPPPSPTNRWHFELQLGVNVELNQQDSELYYTSIKGSYTGLRLRDMLDYKANYGKLDGVVSANNMYGSIRSEYDLTDNKRAFLFNVAGGGYDLVRKIDSTYDESFGVGYKVLQQTNFTFTVDSGLNYQEQYFTNQTSESYIALREDEQTTWKISPTVSWDQKLEFYPRLNWFGEYRARFESNLSFKLTPAGHLYLNLTVIDAYDTLPASGVTRNDFQLRSSVGVKF